MGLFSSSWETVVGTTVSRAIKDSLVPNSILKGLTSALVGGTGIPETVVQELAGSIGTRAERMYRWAGANYVHGLPSGRFKSATEGGPEITAVLETIEGAPVTLQYSQYRPPNMLHVGWTKLVADHGYDTVTNEIEDLTTTVGHPVFLQDMVVVVPAATIEGYRPGALDAWGPSPTAGPTPVRPGSVLRQHSPPVADPTATEAHVLVTYVWTTIEPGIDGGLTAHQDTLVIPLTGFDDEGDYYQVRYTVAGVPKFWMYQAGLGTYPTLDDLFEDVPVESGTFFPFAYFRHNGVSEIADTGSASYLSTKKLVKYLGMDFDQVTTAIDDNPGIADVLQAVLMMAVPATTTNQLELRYLHVFFAQLYESDLNQFQTKEERDLALKLWQNASDLSTSIIVIEDDRFKMVLSNSGMTRRSVAGNLGDVGTCTMTTDTVLVEQTRYNPGTDSVDTFTIPVKTYVYRRQISSSLYDELQVIDLKMRYHITGQYWTTSDEDDDILLIPVDHSIVGEWQLPEREELYARSLHYVFNSHVLVEVQWYQSEFFMAVLQLTAMVSTILSFGADGGSLLAAVTALDGPAITSAVLALLERLVISIISVKVFELIAQAAGVEVAILVAISAALYGGYMNMSSGSVPGAPFADELLNTATNLVKVIGSFYQNAIQKLQAEFEALVSLQTAKEKELEEANKLLEHNNWLNPMVIFGESPDAFYNRTIHSGNVGILAIGAISSYVDNALRLPTLDETT